MKRLAILSILLATATALAATKASNVTQHHITWTFDKEHKIGQFVNGDWWVIGPVNIVAITNDLSDMKFADPETPEVSGSMVNPVVDRTNIHTETNQGYDERHQNYHTELNAAMPNGKPVSKDNPLHLAHASSLVSTVSWLWRSETEKEEGAPRIPAPGKHMRPVLRAAAVLTVVDKAPPEGSFRPAYAGTEKRMFNVSQLRLDRLGKLDPVEGVTNEMAEGKYPALDYGMLVKGASLPQFTYALSHLWLDHIPHWYGGEAYHPSLNMPNYGREMSRILSNAMLALHLDWEKVEGGSPQPDKKPLVINLVQLGIDLAGIADANGFWVEDGGHAAGRKPTILFAGLLLDDAHMKNVGHWDTSFQDNTQVFYVSEDDIERTGSENWKVARNVKKAPYTKEMIGMPEWSFGQVRQGPLGNAAWDIPYRAINYSYIVPFALAMQMFEDGRKLFNREAYFDYADRVMSGDGSLGRYGGSYDSIPAFPAKMWEAYRKNYPTTYDAKKWDDQKILDHILNATVEE